MAKEILSNVIELSGYLVKHSYEINVSFWVSFSKGVILLCIILLLLRRTPKKRLLLLLFYLPTSFPSFKIMSPFSLSISFQIFAILLFSCVVQMFMMFFNHCVFQLPFFSTPLHFQDIIFFSLYYNFTLISFFIVLFVFLEITNDKCCALHFLVDSALVYTLSFEGIVVGKVVRIGIKIQVTLELRQKEI